MRSTILLALSVACTPSGTGSVTGPTDPTTDTDTGTPPTTDTGPPTPTTEITTPPPALTGLSWELDDDIRSIVVVSWTQDGPANVQVEFQLDGEEVRTSPVRTLEAGTHTELLLGVPYDSDVTWRVVAATATGATTSPDQSATTDPLPGDFPVGVLEASEPTSWEPEMDYVLTTVSSGGVGFGTSYWVMILDRQGRAVWAWEPPRETLSWYPRLTWDSDSLLVDLNSYWGDFDGGVDSQILEMKIDGSVVDTWDTPGLHHAFTPLPDGSIVYGRYLGGFGGYREDVVKLDPSRKVEILFNCEDWLDEIGERDVCGSNTVSYHEPTDHLYVSWFTFETIIDIDMSTLAVDRWFGHAVGSYAFDPPSSTFWYQHGGYITDAGTLLTSTHVTDDDVELVVREYEIDDATQTLHEVWNVGVGEGVTGQQMGEAHRLPGGNTLHNFGTNAHLREYTTDGAVVWEMDWELESTIGRSTPILVDLYDLAP